MSEGWSYTRKHCVSELDTHGWQSFWYYTFRKRLVTIPIAALFTISVRTFQLRIVEKASEVNASPNWPRNPRRIKLMIMELEYMKKFYPAQATGNKRLVPSRCTQETQHERQSHLYHQVDIAGVSFEQVLVVHAGKTRAEYLQAQQQNADV